MTRLKLLKETSDFTPDKRLTTSPKSIPKQKQNKRGDLYEEDLDLGKFRMGKKFKVKSISLLKKHEEAMSYKR